jgi:hypothetical protein
MPGFTGGVTPQERKQPFTAYFIGVEGTKRRTLVDGLPDAVTVAQLNTMAQEMGAISNAGLYKWSGAGVVQKIPIVESTVFDELYDIESRLVIEFVNDAGDEKYVRIPAPGAEHFTTNNIMVGLTESVDVADVVTSILAVINAGVAADAPEEFRLSYGYLDIGEAARRQIPNTVEPAAGSTDEEPA